MAKNVLHMFSISSVLVDNTCGPRVESVPLLVEFNHASDYIN